MRLYTEHPEIRFQNEGYQYLGEIIRRQKAEQLARIEEILKEHVVGFSKFFNFRTGAGGEIVLRFNYNWGAAEGTMSFTGVGYLPLDHLRDGFPEGATLP